MQRFIFSFIIMLACSIFATAQNGTHIKFMGIELGGTISEMQSHLEKKGLTIDPINKSLPVGQRAYNGIFSGENAQIIIWYNPRTQLVYRGKAIIEKSGKDLVMQAMNNMEMKLDTKYGVDCKITGTFKDDHLHEFNQVSYNTDYGTIDLFITSTSYSSHGNFFIHVDYKDKVNATLNTMDEMDDL